MHGAGCVLEGSISVDRVRVFLFFLDSISALVLVTEIIAVWNLIPTEG